MDSAAREFTRFVRVMDFDNGTPGLRAPRATLERRERMDAGAVVWNIIRMIAIVFVLAFVVALIGCDFDVEVKLVGGGFVCLLMSVALVPRRRHKGLEFCRELRIR